MPKLQKEWGFANEKAAEAFVESLRDAVAISGVASTSEAADTADEVDAEEPAPNMHPPPINTAQIAQDPRINPLAPPLHPLLAPTQSRSWDLGDGAVVSLTLPRNLSKGNIAKLKKYIAALEMEASIAWDDDDDLTSNH